MNDEVKGFLTGWGSEYWPGSKQKRNVKAAPEPKRAPADWSVHGKTKTIKVHGVPTEVEFFNLEALRIGLDRPAVTIRNWIANEYIPEAIYRMPRRMVRGKEQLGQRLYTRAQVEAILRVFEEHGIRENCRVDWNRHHPAVATEIAMAWLEHDRPQTET